MTADAAAGTGDPGTEALIRIVRGRPSPEELAALIAILVAVRAATAAARAQKTPQAARDRGPGTRMHRRRFEGLNRYQSPFSWH
ncbi:acyl-CoA carboxylase subunit epsilon [Kitasatospora sp. NPDC049285]|uniref:acyl-CoA carboxylase subunit epsilon n=1 Tax=Kitasatospora sp. NPDC049285 TaxID=3157096 RepID=UPI003441DD4D